jgi:hypothetical protein
MKNKFKFDWLLLLCRQSWNFLCFVPFLLVRGNFEILSSTKRFLVGKRIARNVLEDRAINGPIHDLSAVSQKRKEKEKRRRRAGRRKRVDKSTTLSHLLAMTFPFSLVFFTYLLYLRFFLFPFVFFKRSAGECFICPCVWKHSRIYKFDMK